jgi:hypothetical protein
MGENGVRQMKHIIGFRWNKIFEDKFRASGS